MTPVELSVKAPSSKQVIAVGKLSDQVGSNRSLAMVASQLDSARLRSKSAELSSIFGNDVRTWPILRLICYAVFIPKIEGQEEPVPICRPYCR